MAKYRIVQDGFHNILVEKRKYIGTGGYWSTINKIFITIKEAEEFVEKLLKEENEKELKERLLMARTVIKEY